jgi:hypothetical protein
MKTGQGQKVNEKGRKSSWEGKQLTVLQEKWESEGGRNRNNKLVMVKLIIQKNSPKHQV